MTSKEIMRPTFRAVGLVILLVGTHGVCDKLFAATPEATGAASPTETANAIPSGDLKTLHLFVDALKVDDRAGIARLLRYPIERTRPLAPVGGEKEFIADFEDFFDSVTIPGVIEAAKSPWSNWRGTTIGGHTEPSYGIVWNGAVWIHRGKIVALNFSTERQESKLEKIRNAYAPAVRNYSRIILDCLTPRHKILVYADNEHHFFYAAWNKNADQGKNPDLLISGGTGGVEGSAGNEYYQFIHGSYSYDVDIPEVCSGENGDCDRSVTIKKGEMVLQHEICK